MGEFLCRREQDKNKEEYCFAKREKVCKTIWCLIHHGVSECLSKCLCLPNASPPFVLPSSALTVAWYSIMFHPLSAAPLFLHLIHSFCPATDKCRTEQIPWIYSASQQCLLNSIYSLLYLLYCEIGCIETCAFVCACMHFECAPVCVHTWVMSKRFVCMLERILWIIMFHLLAQSLLIINCYFMIICSYAGGLKNNICHLLNSIIGGLHLLVYYPNVTTFYWTYFRSTHARLHTCI